MHARLLAQNARAALARIVLGRGGRPRALVNGLMVSIDGHSTVLADETA